MTKEQVQSIIDTVRSIVQQRAYPKEWRLGQAYFNLFHRVFQQQVDELRGTDKDCFYNDSRIESFIDALIGKFSSVKSIINLQREAFEAGKEPVLYTSIGDFGYETFEDYLKSRKAEINILYDYINSLILLKEGEIDRAWFNKLFLKLKESLQKVTNN